MLQPIIIIQKYFMRNHVSMTIMMNHNVTILMNDDSYCIYMFLQLPLGKLPTCTTHTTDINLKFTTDQLIYIFDAHFFPNN